MRDLPAWGPILDNARAGHLHPGLVVHATRVAAAEALRGVQPVYLATPYSKLVVDDRGAFDFLLSAQAGRLAAREAEAMRRAGVTVFAPIVQSDAMVRAFGVLRGSAASGVAYELPEGCDPLDAGAWAAWCQPLLNVCRAVAVPMLPGWDRSQGIWAEVRFAIERNEPVHLYEVAE